MMFCANEANLCANEANLENPMKTMFEHEQDNACLLGRTNSAILRNTLAKRTVRPLFSLSPFLRGEG
jgi:hypothetical protein